ncbi:uncharacterized protein LOC131990000 isoform X2 [Centropristis striata]|uniref:uncharacterized protein LOC131990000 isoform X2 n=1 Tax=Centropristis striata TaxID=184440 RepID=UPI0027E06798|nr:uncharacterized protein LOC131990000 isoform X2 [Centropristis striata]
MEESAAVEEGISPAQSPLVALSFQRNANRKQKYLEAEPKALGITQIGLSLFQVICGGVFLANDLGRMAADIAFFISSALVIIAGSLAIAAKNLHLPTLRACLGMQIFACGASIYNMISTLIRIGDGPYFCWHYYDPPNVTEYYEMCQKIESIQTHFFAEGVVIQAALLAISVTLAAYCCKVVNCCSPAPKMPVITVQSLPVQQ